MRLTATLQLTSPILTQPDALKVALAKVVAETAFDIERDIKEQMAEPKHGRTYRRGVIGKRPSKGTRALGLRERTTKRGGRIAIAGFTFHRASAPGEAPAIDQGQLVGSINTQVIELHATVGTPLQKAVWLEEGTLRIAPRPSFAPAAASAREPFERRCNEAVEALL
jgi:hypothetical protein